MELYKSGKYTIVESTEHDIPVLHIGSLDENGSLDWRIFITVKGELREWFLANRHHLCDQLLDNMIAGK